MTTKLRHTILPGLLAARWPKKYYLAALFFGLLLMASAPVSALTIGTYTHNYEESYPGGKNSYVTVSDVFPFSDAFSFSGLAYSKINHFDVTLTYSNTNNLDPFTGTPNEYWYMRPGGTQGQYLSFKLNPADNQISTTFIVDSTSSNSEFGQMVAAENFFFSFTEATSDAMFFSDSFQLYSATLTIDGEAAQTPVPEPATMLLLVLGLLGLAGVRRKLNM
ncbi:MAG: PEP-CTERM sorting domain-containing protein [Desulfuromonadales bacterium]